MLYITGLLFALQLVGGQALYNVAVNNAGFELTKDFILSSKMFGLLTSPALIAGVALYLMATVLNFWMLAQFKFADIQAVAVPLVLMFSFIAGILFFDNKLSVVNWIGFGIIVAGVIIATHGVQTT